MLKTGSRRLLRSCCCVSAKRKRQSMSCNSGRSLVLGSVLISEEGFTKLSACSTPQNSASIRLTACRAAVSSSPACIARSRSARSRSTSLCIATPRCSIARSLSSLLCSIACSCALRRMRSSSSSCEKNKSLTRRRKA